MPCAAMLDRRVHVQPLRLGLLTRDDYIDAVPALQTVIGDIEQGVGIGRKIDPHRVGLFIHDMIDESGILMAEAVVILAPDMGGEQII